MRKSLNIKFTLVVAFVTAVAVSCKDSFENPSDSEVAKSYCYFPLSSGRYVIYDVDSVVHSYADDSSAHPDSLKTYYHYQVKEQIDSSFRDNAGNTTWQLSRYKRASDTSAWQFINVWTEQLNSKSAERVEDNVRYIKLSFPIVKSTRWNGNAYNTNPEEVYSYSEINASGNIGGFQFDSSLTVLQSNDSTAIYHVYKKEKFACGVGMIYKENDSLNTNNNLDTTNGYEYRMTLKDYFPK